MEIPEPNYNDDIEINYIGFVIKSDSEGEYFILDYKYEEVQG
mgnify:CR=1 FL=1